MSRLVIVPPTVIRVGSTVATSSSVTVIVCSAVTPAGESLKSLITFWPETVTIAGVSWPPNPDALAVILYVPGFSLTSWKRPSSSVTTVRDSPVSADLTTTLAPTTAKPFESVILPVIVTSSRSCPKQAMDVNNSKKGVNGQNGW
ncbi:hypothetical protein BH10ACI2_BH10ACI2_12110 [soil metagenome]